MYEDVCVPNTQIHKPNVITFPGVKPSIGTVTEQMWRRTNKNNFQEKKKGRKTLSSP